MFSALLLAPVTGMTSSGPKGTAALTWTVLPDGTAVATTYAN
jgi:hypothetical protein